MKEAANIQAVAGLQPDMMGFIFYPASPRYAGELKPEELDHLPGNIRKVGVFVDEEPSRLLDTVKKYKLDVVQLHGQEEPAYCEMLRLKGLQVIKAWGIAGPQDIQQVSVYEEKCDWLLFDTRSRVYGGSGQSFDWELLSGYQGKTPFLLSGGIAEEDSGRIRQIDHPGFAGIDLNSRFEVCPGRKDVDLLGRFFRMFN